jgi:TPR repeat protein
MKRIISKVYLKIFTLTLFLMGLSLFGCFTNKETASTQISRDLTQSTTTTSTSPTLPGSNLDSSQVPGEEEFLNGDYRRAYTLLAPLYPQGNLRAVFYLRIILEFGLNGDAPNSAEASRALNYLASKSADIRYLAKFAPSHLRQLYECLLGLFYYHGSSPDTPKSIVEARKWTQIAASKNFTPAMNLLTAITCEENPSGNCFDASQKAARTGDILALGNLSYIFRVGKGTTPSHLRGVMWAFKAATLNPPSARAQNDLGAYYEEGIVVTRDLEEAKKWYTLALGRSPLAQQNLERLKNKVSNPIFSETIDY